MLLTDCAFFSIVRTIASTSAILRNGLGLGVPVGRSGFWRIVTCMRDFTATRSRAVGSFLYLSRNRSVGITPRRLQAMGYSNRIFKHSRARWNIFIPSRVLTEISSSCSIVHLCLGFGLGLGSVLLNREYCSFFVEVVVPVLFLNVVSLFIRRNVNHRASIFCVFHSFANTLLRDVAALVIHDPLGLKSRQFLHTSSTSAFTCFGSAYVLSSSLFKIVPRSIGSFTICV
mmetsp:Transcript_34425/g.55437  ORF Transcript_34425/g.55437 Transcript_34425/m.55437 type:complete len:229 (-) Transcript_34425:214-900(-)